MKDLCHFEESLQAQSGTISRHYAAMKKAFLPHYLVSCWHMNEFESAAMWRLYAGGNNAIALQTRFDRLASVLPDEFGMGRVRYIDYLTDRIPEGNVFNPIMYKRKSFEHEEEVRAVKMDDTFDATTMQRLYESPAEDWKVYVSTLDAGSAVPIDITQWSKQFESVQVHQDGS